jgi:hypothetical protein
MGPIFRHVRSALAALPKGKRAAHIVTFPLSIADFCFPSRTNSWRCSSASFGFGSKVSMCDGPPSIIRKMHAFALASGECPALGASGFFFASAARSEVNATLPSEAPRL